MSEQRPLSSLGTALSSAFADHSTPAGPSTLGTARVCPSCAGRYPADFRVCPHDATPLEDAPADDEDPMLGQQLAGSYEVLRVIGEGGMGRVYEARHSRLGKKRFAIKVMHPELARQPDVVTRFQREAEAASALSHPNVVAVYDVNTAPDGRPYLVAELLEGEQLGEYLERRGRLQVSEAVSIVRQICRALSVAHAGGIVHRDMKPENVFLVAGGLVKVLDFGISKVAESGGNLTKTGMVMGTPDYMPPEQARGDRVDARADVYAVGAILYRAVTGKKPFEGLDSMATLTAVLVQEPPRPSSLEGTLPLELECIIQRAMAKDAAERYSDMDELDAALLEFDSGGTASAAPSPRPVARAKTLVAFQEPSAASAPTERGANGARWARPFVLLLSALSMLWLLVNSMVAIASLLRWSRGADLTPTETILVPLGVLAAGATPSALWIRYVRSQIWPSTPRSMQLSVKLRRMLLCSAGGYGLAALCVHFTQGLLQRSEASLSEPRWALLAFGFALAVGALVWALARRERVS